MRIASALVARSARVSLLLTIVCVASHAPGICGESAAPARVAQASSNPAPGQNPPPSPAPTTDVGALTLRAALSLSTYSLSAADPLLLKLDYASAAASAPDRPPLNIALVIDRSGSMKEDMKFPYAIEAAREVIANLSERDIVSVIAFNERVLVLSPAGRAVNKPFLYHSLEEVAPAGMTDLSAALLEGIAQVRSQSAEGQVKQVLVLTDGRSNHGITSPASLRKLVEKAHAKGIALSTLGCGTDFDGKLLADLATAGGGRYTYVRSAEEIPGAFKEELRGLLDVTAQNARLEISIEQGAISKVFGQVWDAPVSSHQITMGNLRAGERGIVVLALKPANFKPGATIRATTKLTFDDPEAGERVVRTLVSQAEFAAGNSPQKTAQNEEIVIYAGLLKALEAATEGAESTDRQRYRETVANFAQWHGRARKFALDTRNQDLLNHTFVLKHLLEDMEVAEAQGRLHDHAEVRAKLKNESDYQRYLLSHNRGPVPH